MNLNQQPTVDQLARILAAGRDSLDDHILWVCQRGDVHIDALANDADGEDFERSHPELRARMPIYRRGKGYVGKKAAADRQFVNDVFQTLNREWTLGQGQGQVRRIASYC
ncbi:hypothetical protein AHFPHNDE_01909 [Pseudomonas sp. MM227]|uniref:Uncharacterized protein n=1 Tax=Pseudomonas baltica TaxID=2762576 RepID=A0A7X1G2U4_9PSED|nr:MULTISPECIES: hypothetical protein [Pseudomonas]MBC2677442.1 hypothetical protein [Pseudomonas baltica]MBD8595523.1 hypothetical protein [Pseudomonas sp. CFBP 8758]MBD8621521.1 hypothetical protein [Pseudomonas sp. CFBP 13727]MBD8729833.1 hypothetical protein [Pseudomonas sp. CFBP 13710]MBD8825169.1 hypothetical protein [Pseudomonas sp. CFBP 13602]